MSAKTTFDMQGMLQSKSDRLYQIAAAQSSGDLVTVLQTYEPTAVPISLVYNGQGALPLKLRAFMDFAVQRLKARLLPRAEQPQCGKRV